MKEKEALGRRSRAIDETDDHVIIDESAGIKNQRLDFGVKSSFSCSISIVLLCV